MNSVIIGVAVTSAPCTLAWNAEKRGVAPVLTSPRKRYAPGLRGWTAVLMWPAEEEKSRNPMTAAATLIVCTHEQDGIMREGAGSSAMAESVRGDKVME